MSGLLLIVLMFGYAALTIWLLVKVKALWGKATVLTIAILIPIADDIYYHKRLEVYCMSDAGYKIIGLGSKNLGIFHGSNVASGAPMPDYLNLVPVSFVEFYSNTGGKLFRHERINDGVIQTVEIKSVTASYEFIENTKEYKSDVFTVTEMMVVHRQTGKPLGVLKNMNYYGGWVHRVLLGNLSDSGPTLVKDCGISEATGRYELVNRVLIKD